MKQKLKILYLDDEQHNLMSFKASFRLDYDILLARNTTEAMQHLDANPDIEIVISDQKMPDVTGVEFFEQILKSHPRPIRMLITGFTDIESVIDAINRGNVFRYIRKPWAEAEIRSAIEEGHKFFIATSLLEQKSKEIQAAYHDLDKFAYSVAHELKGPLISISQSIKLIREEADMERIRMILELSDKSTSKLLSFVENMFDYYRLKQGELEISDIDFNKLIKDYKDIYSITGELKNIRFEVNYEHDDQKFRSDESKIRMVINNLLSNAFKYQKKEETERWVKLDIKVKVSIATIRVTDNGIGIRDGYIGSIFDIFYRATTQEPGSGFGLYNVKDAISKLNGTINVESVLDEGSAFTVVIPTKQ